MVRLSNQLILLFHHPGTNSVPILRIRNIQELTRLTGPTHATSFNQVILGASGEKLKKINIGDSTHAQEVKRNFNEFLPVCFQILLSCPGFKLFKGFRRLPNLVSTSE